MAVLDRVLTIKEVAAIAGWHRRRMLRHLLRLNAESGGTLLVNVGSKARPRWTTTLGAVRKLNPAWFAEDEHVEERLAACEERIARAEHVCDAISDWIARGPRASSSSGRR